MSARDVDVLERLGLSGSKAALHLNVSRQALFEGLKREGDYLDGQKIAKLIVAGAVDPTDFEGRVVASSSASQLEEATIRAEVERLTAQNADACYLQFGVQLSEIQDGSFWVTPEMSSPGRYLTSSVNRCYFVADNYAAALLAANLKRRVGDNETSPASQVLVVETNLTRILPQLTLVGSFNGSWRGWTSELASNPLGVTPVRDSYIQRLLLILRSAGFDTDKAVTLASDFMKTSCLEFDGLYFHKQFQSEKPQ